MYNERALLAFGKLSLLNRLFLLLLNRLFKMLVSQKPHPLISRTLFLYEQKTN